ncbi:XRE family transcriptional regulator [Helicobacter pylori]|nr:XRE family transcriptional regulator [Helicobacter pylori]
MKGINCMKLSQILKKIHALIESKEIQNISQQEMANRLGVSLRTYTEWLRDVNQPLAMRAILDMFSQLNDDDIVKIVRAWQTSRVK